VRLELGNKVRCTDKEFGELADVVIDPITKRVTHLVVRATQGDALGSRLVPVELADASDQRGAEIALHCTVKEVEELPNVQDFAYLRVGEFPLDDPDWDVGVQDVLAAPYYEPAALPDFGSGWDANVGLTYDRIPKGEVEVRRSSPVYSADDHHLGEVEGFIVDAEEHVTHFVLERGHLWGQRDVTIPIGEVAAVENDKVSVRLSKDEVGALPSVRVHRWAG
jgi:sporulation protein YlmC with PRC-barrel domain